MFGLRIERYSPSSLKLLRFFPHMPVEEIFYSGRRFSFLFLWAGTPTVETTLSPSRKTSTFEGGVFPILHFSGEDGRMRNNASLLSGSIGTPCGTQRYLPYNPNGDFSKRHSIGEFAVCL